MMFSPRKPWQRATTRHWLLRTLPESTQINSILLHASRARRIVRPLLPIVVRALIVALTAVELRPDQTTSSDGLDLLSRVGVVVGTLSALLSVVFFDVRMFNFVTVAAVCLHFACHAVGASPSSLLTIGTFVFFHNTSILFSALIGRRRSICRPSALRAAAAHKRTYFGSLKGLRHVDVLEAGTRFQACVLVLDYALTRSARSPMFLLTLPFVALFLAGYSTQRNGTVVLLILLSLATVTDRSLLLGFNFTKTVSTISGTILGLSVGPGLLTVDEWLATANQLCY